MAMGGVVTQKPPICMLQIKFLSVFTAYLRIVYKAETCSSLKLRIVFCGQICSFLAYQHCDMNIRESSSYMTNNLH